MTHDAIWRETFPNRDFAELCTRISPRARNARG
jgi:hypothetical protein